MKSITALIIVLVILVAPVVVKAQDYSEGSPSSVDIVLISLLRPVPALCGLTVDIGFDTILGQNSMPTLWDIIFMPCHHLHTGHYLIRPLTILTTRGCITKGIV